MTMTVVSGRAARCAGSRSSVPGVDECAAQRGDAVGTNVTPLVPREHRGVDVRERRGEQLIAENREACLREVGGPRGKGDELLRVPGPAFLSEGYPGVVGVTQNDVLARAVDDRGGVEGQGYSWTWISPTWPSTARAAACRAPRKARRSVSGTGPSFGTRKPVAPRGSAKPVFPSLTMALIVVAVVGEQPARTLSRSPANSANSADSADAGDLERQRWPLRDGAHASPPRAGHRRG